MNWSNSLGAAITVGCLAGCAGCESVDAKVAGEGVPEAVSDVAPQAISDAAPQAIPDVAPHAIPDAALEAIPDAAPEPDPEQYRISVEIPVDDVTISRGENLDVDAMLDERTAFQAADFHLREVVLIARSRRGGSAELLIDEWASGAVDIPLGDAGSWYEVRIPAADVGEAGVHWVVDFTGALDLNLLVAVLEPRSEMLAAATATVREVVVEDEVPAGEPGVVVEDPPVEVVKSVEVVEPAVATSTVVNEVAIVEQPVYHTRTVYRYVDRPVYRYRVSWIYDPARYYVFRDYGGWTYRYFPGTWDWRCYNLSFRLPSRHHHHDRHHRHDSHRHRADRHDGRRYERRDRDDHRGDRDRRRHDGDRDRRHRRDGDDRDRDRRGVRPRGNESPAVVSRPRALWRQVDPGHPRIQLATQRRAEPRVEEGRGANPRLRVSQGSGQRTTNIPATSRVQPTDRPTNPRLRSFQRRDAGVVASPNGNVAPPPRDEAANTGRTATNNRNSTTRNARTRSFERREAQQGEPRATVTATTRRPVPRPTANRIETPEPRVDGLNARTRAFQRRPEQRVPARTTTASRRTTPVQPPVVREDGPRARQEAPRSNPRTRTFQREASPRTAAPTVTRSAQRRTQESRRTVPSTASRQRSAERERGNARTRAFQRHSEPRVVEPQRQRPQPRVQSQPRSTPPARSTSPTWSAPVRSTPPREASRPSSRPQRAAPSRNTTPRERPVQRTPSSPQRSDSGSDARSDESRRSNARTRAFERR